MVYSRRKLIEVERQELSNVLENVEYACGASLQDIEHDEASVLTKVFVNMGLNCHSEMERSFYIACNDPVCFFCGTEDDILNTEEAYPICKDCVDSGKIPVKKISRKLNPTSSK